MNLRLLLLKKNFPSPSICYLNWSILGPLPSIYNNIHSTYLRENIIFLVLFHSLSSPFSSSANSGQLACSAQCHAWCGPPPRALLPLRLLVLSGEILLAPLRVTTALLAGAPAC